MPMGQLETFEMRGLTPKLNKDEGTLPHLIALGCFTSAYEATDSCSFPE